jgi:CHAT domain-containing protein
MGDTIMGSEAALDQRLGGAFEKRMQLGIYPEQIRSHALFFNENPQSKPRGAVVVGLGQVGELTCGLLEGGVRSAMMDYALQVAQCSDERFGAAGSVRSAALSCLLVGSGPGGVRVRDSVEAILRAAVTANERLGEADLHSRVIIDEIEFLELYQDMALAAASALDSIMVDGPLADKVTWPEKVIEPGQGHRRRVRFDEAPGWWHRLEIIEDQGRGGLRFIASTNRARAEITQSTGQLRLAESFIREASRSSRSSADVAKTLFEILLPNRLKQMAPEQRDLVLLVDDVSARYPWELLQDRWSQGEQPMAVAAGLVRQLKTPRFRAHPAHAVEASAFVVGNPDLGGWKSFPDLPGARQEAQKVAELLNSGGYRVSDSIDEKARDILEGLHSEGWRILHLAGHGEYRMKIETDVQPEQSDRGASTKTDRHLETRTEIVSGMVIGHTTFLTPGDVAQMRWVPELVFINCCHLGKTSPSRSGDYGQLAANLGVQFINMGVKAVVAAGWAVDDGAATVFAASFYRQLLAGESFGEAVRAARQDTWARYPDVNTWGAYQCYGDPGFKLHGNRVVDKPDDGRRYYAPVELIADLESLAERIRVQVNSKDNDENTDSVAEMRTDIEQLLAGIPHGKQEQWAARADVAAAVGFAWGETGAWQEAVLWFDKALHAEEGDCPVRAVEQCANFRVRQSAQTWLQIRSADTSDSDFDLDSAADKLAIDRAALVEEIELAIRELDYICGRGPTAERLSLLGSACKRLAWINEEDSPRLEALVNMADYYRRAFELDPKQNPYPFSNWALAELLAERIFPESRGKLHEVFEDECNRMAAVARKRNVEKPDFWDAVGEADCKLLVLLVNPGANQDAVSNQATAITELYRAAAQRGASPREYASVLEHLEFVIEVARCEPGSDLGAGLGAIRAAL